MNDISADELYQLLLGESEVVILDPREEGLYSTSPHIFQSINIPYSKLEWRLNDLLPKRAIRIIVASNNEQLDNKTIFRLKEIGYTNVHRLKEGLSSWEQQGFFLYTGFNTPSKAFGEYIEHEFETPSISPQDLNKWVQEGKDYVIFDSRTPEEHQRGTIPGSHSMPGAELVLRLPELVTNPNTLVVVNCAGRTRSIIGTQSLRNIGFKNKVVALRNGTMGWKLAGFDIECNSNKSTPALKDGLVEEKINLNRRLIEQYKIKTARWEDYNNWISEKDPLTTYLFDVRMPGEFQSFHPRGAIYAPGGQLVQATDTYVASKGSRIILYDNLLVRSAITGSWLKQMGYKQVYQLDPLDSDISFDAKDSSIFPSSIILEEIPIVTASELFTHRDKFTVIDLSSSKKYKNSHIIGAYWCVRSSLLDILSQIDQMKSLVLTSDDPVLSNIAAQEIKNEFKNKIFLLEGGNFSWFNGGLPTENGNSLALVNMNDHFIKPFEAQNQVESMQQYLKWETNLTEIISRDKTVKFYRF